MSYESAYTSVSTDEAHYNIVYRTTDLESVRLRTTSSIIILNI